MTARRIAAALTVNAAGHTAPWPPVTDLDELIRVLHDRDADVLTFDIQLIAYSGESTGICEFDRAHSIGLAHTLDLLARLANAADDDVITAGGPRTSYEFRAGDIRTVHASVGA